LRRFSKMHCMSSTAGFYSTIRGGEMRILITGGAGFIGSHLAETCLEKGHEVYIIDDLSTGSIDNIDHLQKNDQYARRLFVTINSILNADQLLELIGICDVVFHLAAAVGVKTIIDHPLESIFTNIKGTENVLKLCNRFKKRVLLVSTSEVYGKHTHAPLIETDNCIYGPSSKSRWSYAASKLIDEFTALAYFRTTGLEVVIARLFNTIGPRQTGEYGMVVPRFVESALKNETITIYGKGTQTRTFSYVKDVVTALILLIESRKTMGEVFNIGGSEEITIGKLAEKIVAKTASTSTLETIPYEKAYVKDFEDMQRRVPGTQKLRDYTGFTLETSLDHMLEQVIAFYRDIHN
jgi:UDP-glucose 4-epimerase